MPPCSFNDNLYSCNVGPVCKLNILPDFGQLHPVTAIEDAPAPCGIT